MGVVIGFDSYNLCETGEKGRTVCTPSGGLNEHIPCDYYKEVQGAIYSVENHPNDSRVKIDESGKVQALTSRMGTGGGNVPMVMEIVALEGNGQRPSHRGEGPNAVCTRYIVRRLTPTECARLQGFPDKWGDIDHKDDFTDEEYKFWLNVRNTHAEINGKKVKDYTKKQMLTWYNKLLTDSAEYKMWGNGIALPPAIYCMQGMREALDAEMLKYTEQTDTTDLSDAPEEIKTGIIKNNTILDEVERLLDEIDDHLQEALKEDDPTEHVELPEEILQKFDEIENLLQESKNDDEILQDREHAKETTEEETMEINNIEHATTENVIDFNAVEQLRRLADERKALADLKPDNKRFSDDVRAIEFAVSVLEAVGL